MAHDLRYAVRMFQRSPGFAAIALALLALGIGANLAVFSIVDAWLLRPLPLPDAGRLAMVLRSDLRRPNQPAYFDLYRDFRRWKQQSKSFESLAGAFWRTYLISGDGEPQQVNGMVVTGNLFSTLGVAAARGRVFGPADAGKGPVAVISDEFWRSRYGGAEDIVGRSLTLNGRIHRIAGVLPAGFSFRMLNQPADWKVYTLLQPDEPNYGPEQMGPIAAIGRLKRNVSVAAAQAELSGIQHGIDSAYPDAMKGAGVLVTRLQDDNTRFYRSSLLLAAAASGFLLLIACANLATLLLGRASRRQREMSIRAALGSGSGRLMRQSLAESALLAGVGAALGLLIAYGAVRAFVYFRPLEALPSNPVSIDARALLFTAFLASITVILSGLAPALEAGKADLHSALAGASQRVHGSRRAGRLASALVIVEVALSMVLLAGATLTIETLDRLRTQPFGFRMDHETVVGLTLPEGIWTDAARRHRLSSALVEGLRALPGVDEAAMGNLGPFDRGIGTRLAVEGRPAPPREQHVPDLSRESVTPGYFAARGIPLLRGRDFTARDDSHAGPVAILNQTAERRWFPDENAVGHRVMLDGKPPWRMIAGVAGDTRSVMSDTLDWKTEPRIYLPEGQTPAGSGSPVGHELTVYARSQSPLTAPSIRALVHGVAPDVVVGQPLAMEQYLDREIRQPRVRSTLLAGFAGLAILLAAIGLYGVVAQSVAQRTQEIGVRRALGAQKSDVVRMVLRQGLKLTLAGVALGVPAGLGLSRTAASLFYGVNPNDPWTLLGVGAMLVVVALFASFLPARAASRVDPMEALRWE